MSSDDEVVYIKTVKNIKTKLYDTTFIFKYYDKIPDSFKNLNCGYLYVVRLYVRSNGVYTFKIGHTEDFEKRFNSLNNEYDCCNHDMKNFIVLFLVKFCTKKNDEKKLLKRLEPHKQNMTIKSKRKKECFNICDDSYNVIKSYIESHYDEKDIYKNDYTIHRDGDNFIETTNNENEEIIILNPSHLDAEYL